MKTLSPLRYPGGKTILRTILSNLIRNDTNIHSFVEPYAGGAGLGLWLLENRYIDNLFLNDLDQFLYKFWFVVLNDTEKLVEKILSTEINIIEWEKQRRLILDTELLEKATDLEIGFATLFLNRCNRSGIIRGDVGPIGGKKQQSKWTIDVRFNKEDIVQKIRNISAKKETIHLTSLDAILLIENIKKTYDDLTGFLFYLDPPYYENGEHLYRSYYKKDDHDALASYLIANNNLKWVLSYDDAPYIEGLYSKQRVSTISIHHHAHKQKNGTELLISSSMVKMA